MPTDTLSLVINPFTALGAIAGPAVLTNASSILALGTANRLARVLENTRAIGRNLTSASADDPRQPERQQALRHLDGRAHMLVKALRAFYTAIGLFAASALLSAIGSVLATYGYHLAFEAVAIAALAAAAAAVLSLMRGCIVVTRETFVAVRTIEDEVQLMTQAVAEARRKPS